MRYPRRNLNRRGNTSSYRSFRYNVPINGFTIYVVSPNNGSFEKDLRPEISFYVETELGTPVDIQIEWRLSEPKLSEVTGIWSPEPVYFETQLGLASGTYHFIQPPTDLSKRSWYYRLRAGNYISNTWSNWTASNRYLNITSPSGSVVSYIDANFGVVRPKQLGAITYMDMNVGITPKISGYVVYAPMNIGITPILLTQAIYSDFNIYPLTGERVNAAYVDMNIDTSQPKPVIWWIRPEQGKEGYVFNIYGHGFGTFQGQYDGKVQLGNLVCSISRWEIVPASLRTATVVVSGKPRAVSSTTTIPYVLLSTEQRTVQAGDIIEFDMKWDFPSGSRLDIFPYFTISGTSNPIGYGSALLDDTTGDPWISDQPEAFGEWHHRRFIVPVGSYLVGRNITNFGIGWYGSASDTPTRTAQIRSFVVRQADETPLIWVTGDDQTSSPALTYVANTGVLDYAEFDQEGHVIKHGQALDPDVITPEHGWIVAVVPEGAVSSMVQVTLEDN